jgi:hypothetical protein
MMMRMVSWVAAAGVVASSMMGPAVAQDVVLDTDTLKRQLTDACVVEIWRRPEMTEARDTAVRRCQCVTNKVFKDLKPEEVATVSYTRPLVGPARNAVLAALPTCGA